MSFRASVEGSGEVQDQASIEVGRDEDDYVFIGDADTGMTIEGEAEIDEFFRLTRRAEAEWTAQKANR